MGIATGNQASRSEDLIRGPRREVAAAESGAPSGAADGWDVRNFDQVVLTVNGDAAGIANLTVWRLYKQAQDDSSVLEAVWQLGETRVDIPIVDESVQDTGSSTWLVNTLGCDRLQALVTSITTATKIYVNCFGVTERGGEPVADGGDAGGLEQDVDLVKIGDNAVQTGGVNGSLGVGGLAADGAAASGNPVPVAGVDANGNTQTLLPDTNGNLQIVGTAADDAASDATAPIKIGAVVDQVPSEVSADDDQAHLITDTERYLRVVAKAFDTVTASDKVTTQNPSESNRDTDAQVIASATNTAASTVYYPNQTTGIEIGELKHLTFDIDITDGTVTFEGVNDTDETWKDITQAALDLGTFSTGNASFASVGGTDGWLIDFSGLGCRNIRVKVVWPDGTNSILITLMQDTAV